MGSIDFRPMYLLPPLALVSQPALAKASAVPGTPTTVSPSYNNALLDVPSRHYVILSLNIPRRPPAPSLETVIREEVRRSIAEYSDDSLGASVGFGIGANTRTNDFSTDVAEREAGSLGAAVVAAHSKRIAELTRRMDKMTAEGGSGQLLADLRLRLQRAEAARRLAVARVAVAALATEECSSDDGPPCVSSLADAGAYVAVTTLASDAGAKRAAASNGLHRAARSRSPSILHPSLTVANRGARGSRVVLPVRITLSQRYALKSRIARDYASAEVIHPRRSGGRHVSGPAKVSFDAILERAARPSADRLAKARQSLKDARSLLEGGEIGEAGKRRTHTPMLTVRLWRWPGGETWSLTA